MRVPGSPGELPEHLQLQFAGFAQLRLRAHVLSSAAPEGSSRPLAFENMKLTWKTVGGASRAKRPGMFIQPTST